MRIQNNVTSVLNASKSTDGYIGLNNPAPDFHIDAITPAIVGDELFNSFRTSDVPNSRMGMINGTVKDSLMAPTFYGSLVEPKQTAYGLQTLASITNATDIAANTIAVTWFRTGKNWVPNSGNPFDALDPVQNRYAFAWVNGLNIKMHMSARGEVRIGTSLATIASPARNRLEITADAAVDPYGTAIATNGASGIRLTYLTSAKTPLANGTNGVDNTKVLSVDSAGVIVLVSPPTGATANADNGLSTNGITAGAIHLGQNIGAVGNPGQLLSDREIPMGGFDLNFTALNNTTGIEKVEIGSAYGTSIASNSKLFVIEKVGNDPVTNSNAIEARNEDDTNSPLTEKNGIKASSIGLNPNKGSNNGGLFFASNALSFNRGVVGIAGTNQLSSTAVGFNQHTGGLFIADNPSGGNCGIYVKGNTATGDLAAYFDGDVLINGVGTINGGSWLTPSDQMFKTNIDTITNAMSIIKDLKPKQYYYDTTNVYGMRFSGKKQYGLVAQEVETVLPELVGKSHQNAKTDASGNVITQATDYKTVNYNALFGIMLKGMQEQQSKIDSLTTKLNSKDSLQDARLTALENAITQCCSNNSARQSNSNINQLDIELSDKDVIVLNQNVPNPFAEQTTITYNVPASVSKAQLIFFNTNGQVIQTVDIKTRGKGKVNVFASDLSSGLYNYSLVADGKVIDSKKMVRE